MIRPLAALFGAMVLSMQASEIELSSMGPSWCLVTTWRGRKRSGISNGPDPNMGSA